MDALGAQMAAEKEQLMAAYKTGGLPKPQAPTLAGTTLA